jgi:prolyl-tRNA editing enzyme YbaK/EbsC (Cys-tRNA(Pro) deacylase)
VTGVPDAGANGAAAGDPEAAVRAELERLGVAYEVVPCDPALADTAAFCAHYGYALGDSANTIVVVSKGEPRQFVACVVLATTRLDVNHAVRRRLGTRKVSFASPEETVELTGMVVGGVTPPGLPPHIPVWIDRRVMERERVILGGGSRACKVFVSPEIFHRLPAAVVVDDLATDPRASD